MKTAVCCVDMCINVRLTSVSDVIMYKFTYMVSHISHILSSASIHDHPGDTQKKYIVIIYIL